MSIFTTVPKVNISATVPNVNTCIWATVPNINTCIWATVPNVNTCISATVPNVNTCISEPFPMLIHVYRQVRQPFQKSIYLIEFKPVIDFLQTSINGVVF